jgi:hypothetical protein
MAITLTPEIQNTVNSTGTPSGAPQTPTTGPATPEPTQDASFSNDLQAPKAQPPTPGLNFSQQVAKAAGQLGIQTRADGYPKPGSWAASLVGATQHVLSGLGDAANIKAPAGGGALSGIAQTMAARNQRIQAEKEAAQKQAQQQFENSRQTKMDAREDQAAEDQHRASVAHENISALQTQQLYHQQDQAARDLNIKNDTEAMQPFVTGGTPSQVIKKDITSAEAQTLVAQKQLDPSYQHIFATGQKIVDGKDEHGNPNMATTYTVVGNSPTVTLTDPSLIDRINKSGLTNIPIKPGQVLPGYMYGSLIQQVSAAEAAINATNAALEKNQLDGVLFGFAILSSDFVSNLPHSLSLFDT